MFRSSALFGISVKIKIYEYLEVSGNILMKSSSVQHLSEVRDKILVKSTACRDVSLDQNISQNFSQRFRCNVSNISDNITVAISVLMTFT